MSWGSSSMLHRRRKPPSRVIRGSYRRNLAYLRHSSMACGLDSRYRANTSSPSSGLLPYLIKRKIRTMHQEGDEVLARYLESNPQTIEEMPKEAQIQRN